MYYMIWSEMWKWKSVDVVRKRKNDSKIHKIFIEKISKHGKDFGKFFLWESKKRTATKVGLEIVLNKTAWNQLFSF